MQLQPLKIFAIPLEYGTLKNDEFDKKNKTEIKRKVKPNNENFPFSTFSDEMLFSRSSVLVGLHGMM